MSDKHWLILQSKPNSSLKAIQKLNRQIFRTFAPYEEKARYKHKCIIKFLLPLFRGYIFIKLGKETAPWFKINPTIVVAKLITFNNKPSAIPSGLI